MACISFIIYSCTAEQYDLGSEIENELELKANMAMSRGLKSYTAVDSIVESEEFLDCAIAFQRLRNKVDEYMEGLDENGKVAIKQAAEWSNVGDSRCQGEAMKLYNGIKNELQAYFNAFDSLKMKYPSFDKLSDNESLALMKELVVASKPALLKSRSETPCMDKWWEDYKTIEAYWALKMEECNKTYGGGTVELAECLLNCAVACNEDKDRIWEEYKDCLKTQNL